MVSFEVISNRMLPVGRGVYKPFLQVLFGGVLDVEIITSDVAPALIEKAQQRDAHLGDPIDTIHLKFVQAPNFIFDMILKLQEFQESIPGAGEGFVALVDQSAFLLNDDGSQGRQLSPGEYLPI